MTYSDEDLMKLGQCRDAIAASLEKANEAIAQYNAELEQHNVACERVPPVDEQLIMDIETAQLEDMSAFKRASTYAQEAIEIQRQTPAGTGRSASYQTARQDAERCLERLLKHLERYFTTRAHVADKEDGLTTR